MQEYTTSSNAVRYELLTTRTTQQQRAIGTCVNVPSVSHDIKRPMLLNEEPIQQHSTEHRTTYFVFVNAIDVQILPVRPPETQCISQAPTNIPQQEHDELLFHQYLNVICTTFPLCHVNENHEQAGAEFPF